MATKTETSEKKAEKQQKEDEDSKNSQRNQYLTILAIAIVVAIIAYGVYYELSRNLPNNFFTFKTNYNSAARVGLVVRYTNGTYPYIISCATTLIQQLGSNHIRNKSTIDFFVIANSTSCLNWNSTVVPISQCTAKAAGEPSIYINYSNTNSSVITPTSLRLSGDSRFLSQCGVAAELTSS